MNPLQTNQDLDQTHGSKGPGSRLQSARIDRGLSVEDVANRMHLSTGIIDSIEENDFDAITAPIFVKGYLRAYSRIVLLNEDEMISQYIDAFADEDPRLNTTSSMTAELTANDARIKWTTFLVIFVLIVLLGMWWWNKNQNRADVFSLDAPQTETMTQSDIAEDTAPEEIEAISETATDTTAETSDTQAIDVEPEPAVPVEQELVEQEVVEAETLEVETAQAEVTGTEALQAEASSDLTGSEPDASAEVQGEQTIKSEVDDSGLISRLAPMGSDQLFITVNADSWANIKDSDDHQLVYELLRAGQKFELTGQAPFVVFLGNGHGIELTYNGELIDVTSRIRENNTARLKIGS